MPMNHAHNFSKLGIMCERTERPGAAKPDRCYAIRSSCVDTVQGVPAGGALEPPLEGFPVVYDGEPLMLEKGEGIWLPVVVKQSDTTKVSPTLPLAVFPCDSDSLEVVPGIWDGTSTQGMICVIGNDEFDVSIETGDKVAEVCPAVVHTNCLLYTSDAADE